MSIAIVNTTPEGIVMATDSRQSYRNLKGLARIGSDNATKLFRLGEGIGVAAVGLAFLPEEGEMKNISKFIEEFKNSFRIDELDTEEVVRELHLFFADKLLEKVRLDLERDGFEVLKHEKEEIEEEEIAIIFESRNKRSGDLAEGKIQNSQIQLIVCGVRKDSHSVYSCEIPGPQFRRRDSKEKGLEYGADWIGQTDVITRIIKGYDGRIDRIAFINEAIGRIGHEDAFAQLNNLEYSIQWGTMTLQDAVDFCALMIETTSAIQRFSDGIIADPGDMPGVGGPIDIAVITPENGFQWISKKKLRYEGPVP